MRTDIGRADCAEDGVGERVKADIGVRMSGKREAVRHANPAQHDMITRPERMNVIAVRSPHIGMSREHDGLCLAEVSRRRDLERTGVAWDERDGEAGNLGNTEIVGEGLPRASAMGRKDIGISERLRRLHAPHTITRHGAEGPILSPAQRVRHFQSRRDPATFGRTGHEPGSDSFDPEGTRRVMDQDNIRRIALKRLQPTQDARLTAFPTGNRSRPISIRSYLVERLGVLCDDGDNAGVRQRCPDTINGPLNNRAAENRAVLFGEPVAQARSAAGGDEDDRGPRRIHTRVFASGLGPKQGR